MNVQTTNFIKFGLATLTVGLIKLGSDAAKVRRAKEVAAIRGPLQKAEEIFKNFDTASKAQKDELQQHLQAAYKGLRTVAQKKSSLQETGLRKEAARIFYLYGRSLYGSNFEASRQMFQLSLAQSSESPFTNTLEPVLHSEDLNQLHQELTKNTETFRKLDQWFLETDTKTLSEKILPPQADHSLKDSANQTALTLRWLGHSYQNIDQFSEDSQQLKRFEKIYSLASQLFVKIDSTDSRWEAIEIVYNTGRFMHYMSKPGDVEGALATLESVHIFLEREGNSVRAQTLRAQLHNIRCIERDALKTPQMELSKKRELLKSFFDETSAARKIAEATVGFPTHLKTMFLANKVSRAIDCLNEGLEVATLDEMTGWMNEVLFDMEQANYNHVYHPRFAIVAVKLSLLRKEYTSAKTRLKLAMELNTKYPNDDRAKVIAELTLQLEGSAGSQKPQEKKAE